MERAVARIDLGAVAAQLRAAEGGAGRGRRALRGGQGRRLRPRRRRLRRRRRWPAARRGWRWRPRAEAAQIGRRLPHVPLLTMGALTAEELDVALARRLGGRGLARGLPRACSPTAPAPRAARPASTSSTTAAWAGSATPTPSEVLALARACAADPDLELAGVWTHFATADEPDSGFFDEQLDRFAAVAAAVKAEFPDGHRPRRQQRRRLPRPPLPLRHGPLRRRRLRARPLPGRPGRARPRAGALAALLRRRRQALRGRRQRRLRADAGGPPSDTWVGVLPLGYGDGVRRGLSNNAEVLVGGRRYPLVGTVSMDNVTIDLGPETEVEPGDEAVLIGAPGRGGDPRRGGRRAASTRSTTRSPAGSRPRVPRDARAMSARRATSRAGAAGRRSARAGAGRRRRASGSPAAPSATRRSAREVDRPRPRRRRRPRPRPPRRSPRELRRARLRALGRVRDLAGGRRGRAAGRSTSPPCAARRSRPTSPRATSRSAPSRCRSPAASRSIPYGGLADLERGVLRAVGRAQLRRRPAAPAARRAARRRAGPARSTPATVALARAEAAPRRRARRRAPAGRAAPAARRPRPAARPRAARRARPHRRRPARAGGAARASNRAPTTTSTSTATRSRCSSTRSRSRRDLDRFAGERAAEVGALLAEPLADEMTRGTALRFGALLHDIGKPATRAERDGFVDLHRPRPRGRRDRSARSAAGCGPAARLTRHLQGADPAPPAARLPGPRGAAAAAPRPRVPAGDRAGRASTSPC